MSQMTTNYLNPLSGWFEQVRGQHGRMFVEAGGVDPLDNRDYFMFHEYTVLAGSSVAVKVVIAGDTVMKAFTIKVMSGTARVEIVAGGTESGSFNTPVPVFPVNNMSTATPRTSTTTITDGSATVVGGTTMDLFLVNTGDNVNQSSGVSVGEDFAIGFPAGTYYIRVTNTDNSTSTGLIKALWTEL